MAILANSNVKRLLSAIGVANLEHAAKIANLHSDLICQEWAYSVEAKLLVEAVEAAKAQAERVSKILACGAVVREGGREVGKND